jgi:excisionase family DNA binding protein
MPEEKLMTIKDLCEFLQLGSKTVYTMIQKDEIPGVKIHDMWRFRKDKIIEWYDSQLKEYSEPATNKNGLKILIVDDDEQILKIFKEELTQAIGGALIQIASSGIKALISVGRFRPDVILLDINLPEVDGIEVCRRIKEDPSTSHIKIIAITGYKDYKIKSGAMAAGANDFMEKPINAARIVKKIQELIK